MISQTAIIVRGHDAHPLSELRDSTVQTLRLGSTLVIAGSGPAVERERATCHPADPATDIIFARGGDTSYLDCGVWKRTTSGLIIAPSESPELVRFSADSTVMLARIPKLFLPVTALTLTACVTTYPELTVAEQASRAFLGDVVRNTKTLTTSDSKTVDRMVIEMGAAVLRNRIGEAQQFVGTSLRDRALSQIISEATSISLTPQKIAQDCGISLRHLQSVFASVGTSVAAELRRERARVALLMLQDERFDHISIEAVSESAGFGSSASMRRALRDCHASNPTELRQLRRDAPEAGLTHSPLLSHNDTDLL